jgi:hypothetical protein
MTDIIYRAFEKAELLAGGRLDDISVLPLELQVIVRIVSAQGVIDNGGYKYFFGADWDRQPYEQFAEAYEAIGCVQAAADLRRVVSTFPFSEPHRRRESRREYMRLHWDEDSCCVRGWCDALCGDATVWSNLTEYCREHSAKLGL